MEGLLHGRVLPLHQIDKSLRDATVRCIGSLDAIRGSILQLKDPLVSDSQPLHVCTDLLAAQPLALHSRYMVLGEVALLSIQEAAQSALPPGTLILRARLLARVDSLDVERYFRISDQRDAWLQRPCEKNNLSC